MSVVSVYAIFATAEEAERIGRIVVEERLAACINILGICRSIYRWQGEVETAEEVPAILKTTGEAADALISRIAGLHSYDVPCIAVWPIEKLLLSYAEWAEQSVGPLGNA
ncbi:divalent-cation tolerance protein CutA [Sphingomonas daechungensis]|uniref:divalent-cation tolerance protein CutA n=1 Tax=Sphingomonas daechungensis TaxID=1176646 RepID=UPI003783D4B3